MLAQLLVSVPEQVVCGCNNAFAVFASHQGIKVPAGLCERVAAYTLNLPLSLLPLFLFSTNQNSVVRIPASCRPAAGSAWHKSLADQPSTSPCRQL